MELGYDLFPDRGRFDAQFVAGDILDDAGSLKELDGQFDMVHAASFFHLFSWDDQIRVGERLVRFFKPDAKAPLIFGHHVGSEPPPSLDEYRASGARMYPHNVDSFQKVWDIIGEKTGTRWLVFGHLLKWNMTGDLKRISLQFSVSKVA